MMVNEGFDYMAEIFISYSNNDKAKVKRLVSELKQKGAKIWFDDEQILPGDDLIQKMSEGIDQCRYYLICLSPSFDEKPPTSWVKREFKMAMIKENKQGKRSIIPIRLIKGGSIPLEIGDRAYADLSTEERWTNNFPRLCRALNI